MYSKGSIAERADYFGGTSPTVFTKRWDQLNFLPREIACTTATLTWSTPSFRHELHVVPNQGTELSQQQVDEFVWRAVADWLIDQLPSAALRELVPNLLELREFY